MPTCVGMTWAGCHRSTLRAVGITSKVSSETDRGSVADQSGGSTIRKLLRRLSTSEMGRAGHRRGGCCRSRAVPSVVPACRFDTQTHQRRLVRPPAPASCGGRPKPGQVGSAPTTAGSILQINQPKRGRRLLPVAVPDDLTAARKRSVHPAEPARAPARRPILPDAPRRAARRPGRRRRRSRRGRPSAAAPGRSCRSGP